MAETKVFPWDEDMDDLLEGLTPVDKGHWRWGHISYYVFEQEGSSWMVEIYVTHDDGWERYKRLTATKVKPVEVTVVKWVPV